ncbi:MAG: hypothetical protein AB1941_16505 [Gemmatimonadota bacterium]
MIRAVLIAVAAVVVVLLVELVSGGRIEFPDTQRSMIVCAVTASVMAVQRRRAVEARP